MTFWTFGSLVGKKRRICELDADKKYPKEFR